MMTMKLDELHALVKLGESETLEFKTSMSEREAAIETTCALLNGTGGHVLLGVKNKGDIVGLQGLDRAQQKLAEDIKKLEPRDCPPRVEILQLNEDRAVIILHVYEGKTKPYTYNGRPFHKVGSTTHLMPSDLYHRLLLERGPNWEEREATDNDISALDISEINRTVDDAIEKGRLNGPVSREPVGMLRSLNLLRGEALTNAALVLFAKEDIFPLGFPQCLLKLNHFANESVDRFLEKKHMHGNAFTLLYRATQFLTDVLPISGHIDRNSLARIEEPVFSTSVIREVLVNAIVHRDYTNPGGSLCISAFPNKIEVWNIGGLSGSLTINDLYRENHGSICRNPLIAGVFFRRGYIDQYGSGTLRIVSECMKANHPMPEFEVIGESFTARLFSGIARQPWEDILNERQKRLLVLLREIGPALISELGARLPGERVTTRTLSSDLSLMSDLGLVIRPQSRGRGAKWRSV
jgi:ATP-dependent DNA helicase RecG